MYAPDRTGPAIRPDRLADLITHNEVVSAVDRIKTHVFFQRIDDQGLMRAYGVQHESWGPLAEGGQDLFGNLVPTGISRTHGKSVARIALRGLVRRGGVVVPKSVRSERMAWNLHVFDFQLTDGETARIATPDTGRSHIFDHHDPQAVKALGGARFDT